jgi:8-oxo-dGTP diphosphatase
MDNATYDDDMIPNTVGGMLVRLDRKVLLGLRAPWKRSWPGHWDTIGGRVEAGETIEDALVREVQEELGVTPTRFSLIAAVRERKPARYGDALHHVFAVTRWRGEPTNASAEHSEIRWFSIDEMRALPNLVDADCPQFAQRATDAYDVG